ncbi:hypothetical protein MITS9509_02003 [Synechococcus sp. MIT S9509]|nr:hypothetical protein MITS9504_01800 [Synechococcus sp. MIT S9504]KZR92082.1 hypothetical protein MITS9509_02003 [Synechococcus sp. MIT S9509]
MHCEVDFTRVIVSIPSTAYENSPSLEQQNDFKTIVSMNRNIIIVEEDVHNFECDQFLNCHRRNSRMCIESLYWTVSDQRGKLIMRC